MMRTNRTLSLVAAAGLIALTARCSPRATGDSRKETSPQAAAPAGRITIPPDSPQLAQITVATVGTARLPENEVVAPGRIEIDPNRVSRIVLPVGGRIDSVDVRLGDRVAAGQTLFVIDSPDADAALSEDRQSQAAVNQARSALVKAQADRARVGELYDHKAIAKKDVLAADNDVAQAQAALDQALASLEHSRRKLEILGLSEGATGQRVPVKAPRPGKILELAVTTGEYRNDTTTPVMTIADLDTVWVTSAVPEKEIRLIEVGESLQVELIAYPGEVFTARVKRIADTLDPKTRTVQVRAELANLDGRFRPEMFGRIRHSHALRAVPVVPPRAILRRGEDTVIYVERGRGTFERVPVVIAPAIDDEVPVLKGLQAGDRIVVDGVMLLAGMESR